MVTLVIERVTIFPLMPRAQPDPQSRDHGFHTTSRAPISTACFDIGIARNRQQQYLLPSTITPLAKTSTYRPPPCPNPCTPSPPTTQPPGPASHSPGPCSRTSSPPASSAFASTTPQATSPKPSTSASPRLKTAPSGGRRWLSTGWRTGWAWRTGRR